MGIDFRKPTEAEVGALAEALRRNATDATPLHLDPLHTGWIPGEDEIRDDAIVDAIRSVPCHYSDAAQIALALLREEPDYIADARIGAPLGNSVVGSIINLTHRIPRQYAEAGVREALAILDGEDDDAA